MNAARRKVIDEAFALLAQALDLLRSAAVDERGAFDNLPESLQGAERGLTMDATAEALEGIVSDLEDIESRAEEAKGVNGEPR